MKEKKRRYEEELTTLRKKMWPFINSKVLRSQCLAHRLTIATIKSDYPNQAKRRPMQDNPRELAKRIVHVDDEHD